MINAKSLLLATCIAAVPGIALAQSATQAPANSAPMNSTAPMNSAAPHNNNNSAATSAATSGAASSASMKPIAMPSPNQIMGADLRGANVYGANNESIGDIKDIVMTRDGRVDAVIVGVGGFLGIGEKNVAIPFGSIEISESRDAPATASTNAREPATTGSTMGTASTSTSSTSSTQGTMKPQRVVLRNMTKADLEAAPAFRSDGGSNATGTTGTMNNNNTNRTTAPAPAAR